MGSQRAVEYAFGDFRLDLRSRRLLRGDEVLAITVKAFDTLAVLVERAGEVVDKEELMRRVWTDAIVEEANLSQQIFLLRKTLGEGPKDHRYIQTVPRRGYRFVAEIVDAGSNRSRRWRRLIAPTARNRAQPARRRSCGCR